MTFKKEHKQAG